MDWIEEGRKALELSVMNDIKGLEYVGGLSVKGGGFCANVACCCAGFDLILGAI